MRRLKLVIKMLLTVFIAYLGIGYFFHLVVFPEYKPDIANYFSPGDILYGKAEGLKQTILKQENGKVYCKIELEPYANGPIKHIHTGFDEVFIGGDKPVNILVGKEEKILNPGEKIIVPRGTPHKPYNGTDSNVTLMMIEEAAFPEEFAVYLSQVFGYMGESESNMKLPKVLFQMAMFTQHFDSYLGEGPPVVIQKMVYFLIVPAARALGFKSYYKKFAPNRID